MHPHKAKLARLLYAFWPGCPGQSPRPAPSHWCEQCPSIGAAPARPPARGEASRWAGEPGISPGKPRGRARTPKSRPPSNEGL
eukprot:11763371-Alexandrium_andersonii.AAC.1